jgi:hypothetical protein
MRVKFDKDQAVVGCLKLVLFTLLFIYQLANR